MEKETGFKSSWLIAAIAAFALLIAALMYGLGLKATQMPEDARRLNELLWERDIACSGGGDTAKCEGVKRAIKEFEKKTPSAAGLGKTE